MKVIYLGFVFFLATLCAAQKTDNVNAPNVKMKIHRLALEGAEGVDLRSIIGDIESFDLAYQTSCSDGYIKDVIRDYFQRRGYFKVDVSEPRCTLVRRSPHEVWIDVRVRVQPGAVFRLSQASFSKSSAVNSDELRKLFPMRNGDLFRVDAMRAGLKNLRELYCRQGYVNFTPVPNTQIDDSTNTISVLFELDEGEKFFYGDLEIYGEESVSGARQKLIAAWETYKGKPYDCGASLESVLRDVHALPSIKPDEVFNLRFDNQSHVVTVEITLAKPPQGEVAEKQQ